VRDLTDLLHRTLGETIDLECVFGRDVWTIEADHNQLESAIVNLAVSARAGETILVVEDNPEVRAFSSLTLAELGYHIIEAANAD
jgi:hypothetical protein